MTEQPMTPRPPRMDRMMMNPATRDFYNRIRREIRSEIKDALRGSSNYTEFKRAYLDRPDTEIETPLL